jgi:hypothetical protein
VSKAFSFGVWIAWTVSTAVSGGLAFILAAYLVPIILPEAYFSSSVGLTGDNLIPHFLVWLMSLLALASPLIGFSQGLVLAGAHYKEWRLWAIASSVGVFIAILLIAFSSTIVGQLGVFLVPGYVYGLAQWFVLRRSTKEAFWWVVANGIGWIIAVILGLALANVLLPGDWNGLPFYPAASAIHFALTSSIIFAIFAAITGLVLLVLLKNRSKEV